MVNLPSLKEMYDEPDYSWKARHPRLIAFVKGWLEQHGEGKTYSNRDITAVVLRDFGLPQTYRQMVSRDISGIARQKEMKLFTRIGPEIKLYGKNTRTRLFAAPGAPVAEEQQEETPVAQAIAVLRINGWMIAEDEKRAYERNVEEVDKPEFSRHPKPGYKPVTCGDCGGSGTVYMKG